MYKLVGFRHTSFKPKDSDRTISGFNLYVTYSDSKVTGVAAERLFVTDDNAGGFIPAIGEDIIVEFNKYGKVAGVISG